MKPFGVLLAVAGLVMVGGCGTQSSSSAVNNAPSARPAQSADIPLTKALPPFAPGHSRWDVLGCSSSPCTINVKILNKASCELEIPQFIDINGNTEIEWALIDSDVEFDGDGIVVTQDDNNLVTNALKDKKKHKKKIGKKSGKDSLITYDIKLKWNGGSCSKGPAIISRG